MYVGENYKLYINVYNFWEKGNYEYGQWYDNLLRWQQCCINVQDGSLESVVVYFIIFMFL